jgi:hypothetical protein
MIWIARRILTPISKSFTVDVFFFGSIFVANWRSKLKFRGWKIAVLVAFLASAVILSADMSIITIFFKFSCKSRENQERQAEIHAALPRTINQNKNPPAPLSADFIHFFQGGRI